MKLLKVLSISLLFVFLSIASTAFASSTDKVFGQAWSSNIGWISFNNCTLASSCSGTNYGVTVDTNGNLSGQAWSSNVGWLSFNGTSGCPIAGCTTQPKVNLTTGTFSGWARFIGNGGGWDGWVNLNGLVMNTSTGVVSGHAWGSDVVGWIVPMASFKITLAPPTVTVYAQNMTIAGSQKSAGALTVPYNTSVRISWKPTGATHCYCTYAGTKGDCGEGVGSEVTGATLTLSQSKTFSVQCDDN